MPPTYKKRYGIEWPAEMSDELVDLTLAKKWRTIGTLLDMEIKDPWVPLLDAAKRLLPDEYFRVSEWTEQHFHDFVMHDKLVTWGCASSGKAVLPDEPVCVPGGTVPIGSLSAGDLVISGSGRPVRVMSVHRQKDMPLYRVTFSDGSSVVCAKDHLWTVDYWGRTGWTGPRSSMKGKCGWRRKTVPVDVLAVWKNPRRRRLSVPLPGPVEYSGSGPLPVPAYSLGCLIGDASMTQTVILTSDEKDRELRDRVSEEIGKAFPGYSLKRIGKSRFSYVLVGPSGEKRANPVVSALKGLGLYGRTSHDKFVPEAYMVATVADRFDLLAGLFDTDGTVSASGHASFSTVSRRLAEDVKRLLWSVGADSSVSEKKTPCGVSYTVSAKRLPEESAKRLFFLRRKRDRVRGGLRGFGKLGVESVEPVGDRDSYPRETVCITVGELDEAGMPSEGLFVLGRRPVVTHNSNDTALLLLLDWLVDPYDTVTLLGSTTKEDLKSRSWEAVVRYHNALMRNPLGLSIPGKVRKQGQALVNVEEDENVESAGEKAGIQGRALNEDGRLQGAHAKYVRLVVDELAEISNHEAIKVAMANLRVGTESFKFIGLANPESWENPSCQYCMPEEGPASVNVDTGSWTSTFGCFVRHHDGMKSPCVKDPALRKRFPFLLSAEEVASTLREAGGNADAPQFWKMVRGFPVPAGTACPTVLDSRIAERNRVGEPNPSADAVVGTVAGIDPAWSEGGDGAYRARAYVRRDPAGRYYLDFTDGLERLLIFATDPRPPVQQMRDQVIQMMRRPGEADFRNTAVDSSANQGLGDDLLIYAGADCLQVNNSVRASDSPLRGAGDLRPAKETVYDRGTEAWCVLAEFCKAGQVRGLPQKALEALTTRRFALKMVKDMSGRKTAAGPVWPLRMEDKGEFRRRFKKSPDECDACALAALAAKERFGLVPFGFLEERPAPFAFSSAPKAPSVCVPDETAMAVSPDAADSGGFSVDPADAV